MYKLAVRLMFSGLAISSQIKGCSRSEIKEIRELSVYPLPKAYIAFLSVMGWGAGHFLTGIDVFYPQVLRIREGAEALLDEDGSPFNLSPNHFVFSMHQGYQFNYFDAGAGEDDPAVYDYIEGEMEGKLPVKIADRFSEYLLLRVKDHEKIHDSLAS
jgi:hypothetical protein